MRSNAVCPPRTPTRQTCKSVFIFNSVTDVFTVFKKSICMYVCMYVARGGGVLPYITYIGMCRCEGYGFQAVWSWIGYRNQ